MRKYVAVLIILFLVAPLLIPRPVYACSFRLPFPAPNTIEAKDQADVVFLGKVIHIEAIPQPEDTMNWKFLNQVQVTFDVKKSWKGLSKQSIVVQTGHGGGDCGYDFSVDAEYLVWAYREDDDRLTTSIMSRTSSAANSQLTIFELDLGVPLFVIIGAPILAVAILLIWKRQNSQRVNNQ